MVNALTQDFQLFPQIEIYSIFLVIDPVVKEAMTSMFPNGHLADGERLQIWGKP